MRILVHPDPCTLEQELLRIQMGLMNQGETAGTGGDLVGQVQIPVEAMEEMVYLDHADLMVVDHPADVTVHPDERCTGARPPSPRACSSRRA